jgi:Fic-DOC domain mobile mystery protein B
VAALKLDHVDGATPIDEDEAADLIPTHISTIRELNEWEQTNILRAEEWLSAGHRRQIVADAFVRELHNRMFDQTWRWAGSYRQSDKNLGVHWRGIAVAVRERTADAAHWMKTGAFDLDEIAVRLHHTVVAVHPFPNGNGRLCRLLADTLVRAEGRGRFSWGGGANLQSAGAARAAYLAALRAADGGDYSLLLAFARS